VEILQAIAFFNEPQRRREHRGRREEAIARGRFGDRFFNKPPRRQGRQGRIEEAITFEL